MSTLQGDDHPSLPVYMSCFVACVCFFSHCVLFLKELFLIFGMMSFGSQTLLIHENLWSLLVLYEYAQFWPCQPPDPCDSLSLSFIFSFGALGQSLLTALICSFQVFLCVSGFLSVVHWMTAFFRWTITLIVGGWHLWQLLDGGHIPLVLLSSNVIVNNAPLDVVVLGVDFTQYAHLEETNSNDADHEQSAEVIEAVPEKDMVVDLTSTNMDASTVEPTINAPKGHTWWHVDTGANSMMTNRLPDLISPIAINAVAKNAQKGASMRVTAIGELQLSAQGINDVPF